jgi:hypothetical protein
MITGETLLRRADGALATTTSEGTVVLLDEDYQYLQLNDTACRVWQLLEEPRSVEDLVDVLTVEFGISGETCREGVLPLVELFLERGVLVMASPG